MLAAIKEEQCYLSLFITDSCLGHTVCYEPWIKLKLAQMCCKSQLAKPGMSSWKTDHLRGLVLALTESRQSFRGWNTVYSDTVTEQSFQANVIRCNQFMCHHPTPIVLLHCWDSCTGMPHERCSLGIICSFEQLLDILRQAISLTILIDHSSVLWIYNPLVVLLAGQTILRQFSPDNLQASIFVIHFSSALNLKALKVTLVGCYSADSFWRYFE